jgi:hypothetical protein
VASSASSLTSITSSVLQGKVEDGRVYAVYGKEGKPGLHIVKQHGQRVPMLARADYADFC